MYHGERFNAVSHLFGAALALVGATVLVALPLLVDQCLCEALADFVVVQDVGLHVDVVARRQDGRVHRLERGRAVLQQQHLVAGGQRAADDGFFEREVSLEDVGGGGAVGEAV